MAFNNALDKLPWHSTGLLHATKSGLGKAWTGFGEEVDLVDPLVRFGCQLFIPTRIAVKVATKESLYGSIRPRKMA